MTAFTSPHRAAVEQDQGLRTGPLVAMRSRYPACGLLAASVDLYAVGSEDVAQPSDPIVVCPTLCLESGRAGTGDVLRLIVEEEQLARREAKVGDDVLKEGGRRLRCADIARVVRPVEDLAVRSLLAHAGRTVGVLVGREVARRPRGLHQRNDLKARAHQVERRPHRNDVVEAVTETEPVCGRADAILIDRCTGQRSWELRNNLDRQVPRVGGVCCRTPSASQSTARTPADAIAGLPGNGGGSAGQPRRLRREGLLHE